MATQATLLDRIRMLEDRLNYLERGQAVGITGTDQTIKGCHDRLDAFLGAGSSSAAMNRWFVIPATRGYVGNTSAPIHGADPRGWLCDDGVDTYVIGESYLPADYSSGLTVVAVTQVSDTTGAMYAANVIYYAAVGEAYNASNATSGYDAVDNLNTIAEIQSVAVPSAAAGDYITCVFHRDGNNASDTGTAMAVYLKGWRAYYTASR